MRTYVWRRDLPRVLAVAAALAITVTSCTDKPPPAKSGGEQSPPGPTLHGTLLVRGETAVLAVTAPDGKPVVTTVVDDVKSAALSPDGRTLAYVTGAGRLVLRDIASGTAKPLAVHAGSQQLTLDRACMSWSLDGRRLAAFATGHTGLYAVARDGSAAKVDAPKSARYVKLKGTIIRRPDPNDKGVTIWTDIGCPAWLDAERLVFDRVAAMPEQISQTTRDLGSVANDTTTVADLSAGQVRLADTRSRWSLSGTCGERLITRNADGARFLVDRKTLTGPDATTPAGGQLPKATEYGFIPGTCDVLLIDRAADKDLHPVRRYAAATGAVTDLPAIGEDAGAPPRLDPALMEWQPGTTQAGTAVFAWGGWYADDGAVRTMANKIALHDIVTGGRTVITVDENDDRLVNGILGWLP